MTGRVGRGAEISTVTTDTWSITELRVGCIAVENPQTTRDQPSIDRDIGWLSLIGSETCLAKESRKLNVAACIGVPPPANEVRQGLFSPASHSCWSNHLGVGILYCEGELSLFRGPGGQ